MTCFDSLTVTISLLAGLSLVVFVLMVVRDVRARQAELEQHDMASAATAASARQQGSLVLARRRSSLAVGAASCQPRC